MTSNNKQYYEEPVAMYITDAGTVMKNVGSPSFWSSLKDNRYFPILNLINLDPNNELKFTTGVVVDDDVTTYNHRVSSQRPNRQVMMRSRLDISTNDLFVGGIRLCLNFTKYTVTIVSESGIPKMYKPLQSQRFTEYDGELVFFTIHTLNSPYAISGVHGFNNYLENLSNRLAGTNNPKEKETLNILNFAINNLQHNRDINNEVASDTLKLVTMFSVREEELIFRDKKTELYIANKGLLISSDNIVATSPHPAFKDALIDDKGVLESIKANGVSCFIVDDGNLIGERYFNFAGEVIKIPKIESRDNPDGFYIVSIDADKKLNVNNIIPLSDIDENKYVYKSVEEARDGGDLRSKFMEESELRKIIRNEESLTSKLEYEEKLRQIEESSRIRINQLEDEARQNKLAYEGSIRDLGLELEKTKSESGQQKFKLENESMVRKNDYETGKFNRDSFVETLKTVGAVAGLALGLFALYTKFSK